MSEHVSVAQWEAFWAKTLPTPEMIKVAEHHSTCDECRKISHEVFMRRRNYAPIVIDLSDEHWFKDDHLDLCESDVATAYVAGELDEDDQGWIEAHLRTCARCLNMIHQAAETRRQPLGQSTPKVSDL